MNLEHLNLQELTEREAVETSGGHIWMALTPETVLAIVDTWIGSLPEAP